MHVPPAGNVVILILNRGLSVLAGSGSIPALIGTNGTWLCVENWDAEVSFEVEGRFTELTSMAVLEVSFHVQISAGTPVLFKLMVLAG
jgi:hypothetical protein